MRKSNKERKKSLILAGKIKSKKIERNQNEKLLFALVIRQEAGVKKRYSYSL